MKRLLLVLLCCSCAWAGWNDGFATDPNCLAVYRFENGALTTDSKGSNTLTASGSAPTADTVNYQEGAASVDFERNNSQNYTIVYASLPATWPGVAAGYDLSVTFFMRPETTPGGYTIIDNGSAIAGWMVSMLSNDKIQLSAQTAAGLLAVAHETALIDGTWYFIAVTLDSAGSASTHRIHIYDVDADSVHGADLVATTGYAPTSLTTEDFHVASGSYGYYDGLIDELTIWNHALTANEIDQIRQGTYSGPSSSTNLWWWRRRHGD